MLTIFTSLAFLAACNNRIDIKSFVQAELYKSKEKPLVTFYKDSAKTASYNEDLRYKIEDEDSKGNLIESLYLPSGKEIYTEIPITLDKLMADVTFHTRMEVEPKYQALFDTIEGTTPTFDDNEILLPETCLTARGENRTLTFRFNLHADLADNKTAEGKEIPVVVKLLRVVDGKEDKNPKATIPFTISCNSPPPAVNITYVKNRNTGNLSVLLETDVSDEEFALRHRDIEILRGRETYLLNRFDVTDKAFEWENIYDSKVHTFTAANYAWDPDSFTASSASFDAKNYELLRSNSYPTVKNQVVCIDTNLTEKLNFDDIVLVDEAGLEGPATSHQGGLPFLAYPTVVELATQYEMSPYQYGMGGGVSLIYNLIPFQNGSGLEIKDLTERNGNAIPSEVVVSYTVNLTDSSGKTYTVPDTRKLTLPDEEVYSLRVEANATGYASVETRYYLVKQSTIYVDADNGLQNGGSGTKAKPFKTLKQAIDRIGELKRATSEASAPHAYKQSCTILQANGTTKLETIPLTIIELASGDYTIDDITIEHNVLLRTASGAVTNAIFTDGTSGSEKSLTVGEGAVLIAENISMGKCINQKVQGALQLGNGCVWQSTIDVGSDGGGSSGSSLLYMSGTATIKDCLESGVRVKGSGSFFLMAGGDITNCGQTSGNGGGTATKIGANLDREARCGGGVLLENGASFTMTSGKITKNNIHVTSGYADGGGVAVLKNCTFTLDGGTISGNHVKSSASSPDGNAGGVYVGNEANFTMKSGTISGNTCTRNGGGIYASSDITIQSGTISGNILNGSGGGIFIDTGVTFTMTGGTISGHNATYGGGVYVAGNGTINMSGGTITGNSAQEGGGIYIKGTDDTTQATCNMSGGTISNNDDYAVYLGGFSYLNLSDAAYIPYNNQTNYLQGNWLNVKDLTKHGPNDRIAININEMEYSGSNLVKLGNVGYYSINTNGQEAAYCDYFNLIGGYHKFVWNEEQTCYQPAMDYTKVTKQDIVDVMADSSLEGVTTADDYMNGYDEVCNSDEVLRIFLKTTDESYAALEGKIENEKCVIFYTRFYTDTNGSEKKEEKNIELTITDDYSDGSICSIDTSIDGDDIGDISFIVKDYGNTWNIGVTGHENSPQVSYYIFTPQRE